MEYNYVRMALGHFSKYCVLPEDQAVLSLRKYPSDSFVSVYRFTEDYFLYWKETGSVEGYEGPCECPELIWDVDCKDDLNEAARVTKVLTDRLQTVGLVPVTWFSGKKGFHVEVNIDQFLPGWFDPGKDVPQRVGEFCMALASNIPGKAKIDDIYGINHLIRARWSFRKDGGRKIPVELTDTGFTEIELPTNLPVAVCDPVMAMCQFQKKQDKRQQDRRVSDSPIEVVLGAFGKETRHLDLVQYLVILKQHRFPQEEALLMAGTWNRALTEPIDDERIDRIVTSLYKRSTKFFEPSSIVDMSKILLLANVVPEPWVGTIPTGIGLLDNYLNGGFMDDGKIIIVIGISNVGKSLLAESIGIGAGNAGKRVLLVSMEMSAGELADRGKTYLKEGAPVFVICGEELSIDQIEQYIEVSTENGGKFDLVIIDHVGLIHAQSDDRFESADKVAKGLFSLARRTKTTILEVSHVTECEDMTIPPPRKTRDSRSFIHGADLVLACYRSKSLEFLKIDCYKFRQRIEGIPNPLRVGSSLSVKLNELMNGQINE